jgi:transposase
MIDTPNWTAYNAAQVEEKARFAELLADLCAGVPQPEQTKGRPRLPLADMIFASVYKVYVGFSARRFTTDLRAAYADGLIDSTPHFNSVKRYMAKRQLTEPLKELVVVSSLPLKAVETDFVVDASGFTTSNYVRWVDKRWGRNKETAHHDWFKAHLVCGVKTKIVTSVDISGSTMHDSYFLPPLTRQTAENFEVREVAADKAYLSHANTEAVERLGATPFIPFTPRNVEPKADSAWARMYHLFHYRREEFMAHYHKRSSVESVFSMVKAKFGSSVRSKSEWGQVNEVLCKVLAHNLCVLIRAMHELDIEPAFGSKRTFGSEMSLEPKLFIGVGYWCKARSAPYLYTSMCIVERIHNEPLCDPLYCPCAANAFSYK